MQELFFSSRLDVALKSLVSKTVEVLEWPVVLLINGKVRSIGFRSGSGK